MQGGLVTTNGEANRGLSALNFSTLAQHNFNQLRDEIMRAGDGRAALLYQSTPKGRELRACLLRDWLLGEYEVYKTPHPKDEYCSFYYRPRNPRTTGDSGRLSDDDIVFKQAEYAEVKAAISRIHMAIFPNNTASADMSEAIRTVMSSVVDLLDKPEDRYIYIGLGNVIDRGELLPENGEYKGDYRIIDLNDEYLDEAGELTMPLPRVFYRLFDSRPSDISSDDDTVYVPPLTEEMLAVLRDEYDQTLEWLNTNDNPKKRPRIPNKLEEIDQWACGVDDRYRDIIHMASARLKKHDYGVYFLTGLGRNGKSSCIDLIASLYGVNNRCKVCIDDLGDNHKLNDFKRALVNLPDEQKLQSGAQKTMSSDAVKAFRIAAAHSSDSMNVMRSNKSDNLSYSFVTVAPVNRLPNFPPEEMAACIDRCRIIAFQGNFKASDKMHVKWGKVHFTPTFMMRFAGQVLAYASYYSSHAWVVSEMMKLESQKQYEDSASHITYMKMWERVFIGFDSYQTLIKDYKNYCKLMDLEETKIDRNSILLTQYNRHGVTRDSLGIQFRYRYSDAGMTSLVGDTSNLSDKARAAKILQRLMYKRSLFIIKDPDDPSSKIDITGGKTISDFHDDGGSIIFELDDRGYFSKLDDKPVQLSLLGGEDEPS